MPTLTRTIQTTPAPAPAPASLAGRLGFAFDRRRTLPSSGADRAEAGAVLVLGLPNRTEAVCEQLRDDESFSSRVVAPNDLAQARHWVSHGCVDAIIHVVPLKLPVGDAVGPAQDEIASIEDALATLRLCVPHGRTLTQVALLPAEFDRVRARGLYGLGLRAAFCWPDDLNRLPRLVNQMLAARIDPEHDLESAIRERLQMRFGHRAGSVEATASADHVRLSGEVASYWIKRAVERELASVPGVSAVHAEDLQVRARSRSDASIGREIRALMDTNPSIDARTLGVSVHDGRVVLMGAAIDDERALALDAISIVPGVRAVTDLTREASCAEKQQRAELASQLEEVARQEAEAESLRVAVVKHTAIVRGAGTRGEIKRALAALRERVEHLPLVARVVDHAGPMLRAV